MQNEILEKLKVKKTPKAQEAVLVNIPRKKINVSVNTTVIDNTNKSDVDREDFLKNIKGNRRIYMKRAIKPPPIPSAIVEDDDGPSDDGPSNDVKTSVAKPSKIKKLKVKIKLNSDDPSVAPKTIVRKTKPPQGIADVGPITMVEINNETLANRIGPKAQVNKIKASAYYLNNRQIFVNFVTSIFNKYKVTVSIFSYIFNT